MAANINFYPGKYMNNITLNKIIKTLSLYKRNVPRGIVNRLGNEQMYKKLDKNMFKLSDLFITDNTLANVDNPLLVGINDNLSIFNKNYTSMNIFDTNVRVTIIHSNQLIDTDIIGSKYINTLQYKSQNLFSNTIKSIIGKILTVLGLYDINDYKNNKPWRSYIMDTTRLTIGGDEILLSTPRIIRDEVTEYYIRIPLLLKFYKTIFYDISQNDDSIKKRLNLFQQEDVRIIPEFDPPFDALIKHYFIFSNNSTNDYTPNITFNKQLYININILYDYFKKENKPNMLNYVAQQLVKEINQKYGLLFKSDLTLYKTKIARYFGMDNEFISSLYDDNPSSSLYDGDGLLNNTGTDSHDKIPSQKYTTVKNPYKNDSFNGITNFSARNYYENIHDFRKFLQSILTDSINDKRFSEEYNLYSSFFDIDEYIAEIKNEFKNNTTMTDDEKISFLSSATHSNKTPMGVSDSNKKQLLFDFVITPLKQIDNLMNFLAHLRAMFSNEIINSDSNHSINIPFCAWYEENSKLINFSLPSNSKILHHICKNANVTDYKCCAIYGFIEKNEEIGVRNLLHKYVPFSEMMVPNPLNYEYNYLNTFYPHDYVRHNGPIYTVDRTVNMNVLNARIRDVNLPYPHASYQVRDSAGADIRQLDADIPPPPPPAPLPYDALIRAQRDNYATNYTGTSYSNMNNSRNYVDRVNEYVVSNPTYNKEGTRTGLAYVIDDILYLDSQYHNGLEFYDVLFRGYERNPAFNPKNPSYGLLGKYGENIDGFGAAPPGGIIHTGYTAPVGGAAAVLGNNIVTGRRLADGKLLGDEGIYENNRIQEFPINFKNFATTNFRLIASWCPEDLAPNRLGLHEYPYIKQGHLQNRAYNSTYSAAEYLISKLLKNCNLFGVDSVPTINSTFHSSGSISITFNKVEKLISEQIYNVSSVLNEFKSYILNEYIQPCEFYLRTITFQYNDLFRVGYRDGSGTTEKISIYDIQSNLNKFLSGELTSTDITKSANNKSIKTLLKEDFLYLDPCLTPSIPPNDQQQSIVLSNYTNDDNVIAATLNKMGARLITKLINPLLFNTDDAKSYVYNPKRLAYLPHQKLSSPLNTSDDQYYGKLSMEFFSDIQGIGPSGYNMIKTSDLLYSEPNPKYCNFYFTNIVNSVNYIIGILLKASVNNRDKKIYNKIVDIFKNQNEILSNVIDNRFEHIKDINYLGDYGRTGHGTYFDKSLPFILYNASHPELKTFIDENINADGDNSQPLRYMTNYTKDKYNIYSIYSPTIYPSFHHLTLSSVDGISINNYMSSYICEPTEIGSYLNLYKDISRFMVALENNDTHNGHISMYGPIAPTVPPTVIIPPKFINLESKFRKFKDTHEGMYPVNSSIDINNINILNPPAAGGLGARAAPFNAIGFDHFDNIFTRDFAVLGGLKIKCYFGYCNIGKSYRMYSPDINNQNIKHFWFDIIGRPGYRQPLAQICERVLPNDQENYIDNICNNWWIDNNENMLIRLNNARKLFSKIYSYGSIQPGNFIYNNINKFNLKPVIINPYDTTVIKYNSIREGERGVRTLSDKESKDIGAKWIKSIPDPIKFFSRLQPFTSVNTTIDSYILAIISESLHGQFAPCIISSTYNGRRGRFTNISTNPDFANNPESIFNNRAGRWNSADSFRPLQTRPTTANVIDLVSLTPGVNYGLYNVSPPTIPIIPPAGAIHRRPYNDSLHYTGLDQISTILDKQPHELHLTYVQYSKDHLRLGQAVAAYNPFSLDWETFQPLQLDISEKEWYTSLKKLQFKNKNKEYITMFYKLSYAKLLADLIGIDSKSRLEKLTGKNNVLYTLSLSSSYSTPRNEYFGSSLFEYRPTFLSEPNIDKKLFCSPFLNQNNVYINVTNPPSFEPYLPYDIILSLEMGGTGYWEPTGKHPVIETAFYTLTSYITQYQDRMRAIRNLPNVPNWFGDENLANPEHRALFSFDVFNNPPIPVPPRPGAGLGFAIDAFNPPPAAAGAVPIQIVQQFEDQGDPALAADIYFRYYINHNLFGFNNPLGIQNGILQSTMADRTRFGYDLYEDDHLDFTYNIYPDAYVPLEDYLVGNSVLNSVERGLKDMAKEIHDVIFNKSVPKIKEIDDELLLHYPEIVKKEKIINNSLINTALMTISTYDNRMGPFNMLSPVECNNNSSNTITTAKKLITGGADYTAHSSTHHNILSTLSTNILSIALRNSDEPIAINFQDNDKGIKNGNVLFKTFSTIIKNMQMNFTSKLAEVAKKFIFKYRRYI